MGIGRHRRSSIVKRPARSPASNARPQWSHRSGVSGPLPTSDRQFRVEAPVARVGVDRETFLHHIWTQSRVTPWPATILSRSRKRACSIMRKYPPGAVVIIGARAHGRDARWRGQIVASSTRRAVSRGDIHAWPSSIACLVLCRAPSGPLSSSSSLRRFAMLVAIRKGREIVVKNRGISDRVG